MTAKRLNASHPRLQCPLASSLAKATQSSPSVARVRSPNGFVTVPFPRRDRPPRGTPPSESPLGLPVVFHAYPTYSYRPSPVLFHGATGPTHVLPRHPRPTESSCTVSAARAPLGCPFRGVSDRRRIPRVRRRHLLPPHRQRKPIPRHRTNASYHARWCGRRSRPCPGAPWAPPNPALKRTAGRSPAAA